MHMMHLPTLASKTYYH